LYSCTCTCSLLVLADVGLRSKALSAPLVAIIEPLLEGQHRVSFDDM